MNTEAPQVAVVMGSASDRDVMQGCVDWLLELEIPYEVRILSAHRTPELARQYAVSAAERGIRVIVAGAGWAAHLAGAFAAHCPLPVIGVPIDSSPLNGLDALLSTVQMPPGFPVATVAVGKGGARNAAVLAAQILALQDAGVAQRLTDFRQKQADKVVAADEALGKQKGLSAVD